MPPDKFDSSAGISSSQGLLGGVNGYLGSLRLGINTDYDRLQELANQHNTVRQFLGHSDWCDDTQYSLQRLRDNLRLFTPEILDQINHSNSNYGKFSVTARPLLLHGLPEPGCQGGQPDCCETCHQWQGIPANPWG